LSLNQSYQELKVKNKEIERWPVITRLKGALVVSCQASEGEPLAAPAHIKALALSVITGGAQGLRLEGAENVKVVRRVTKLPIIGLSKTKDLTEAERLKSVYITATFDEAKGLALAGADIIALDATARQRIGGENLADLIAKIHQDLKLPVMADISRFQEAESAESLGADLISTTLFGYTEETAGPKEQGPALDLLEQLKNHMTVPVILEGRIWHPEEVTAAFNRGAYAVVVGSAITRPQLITARFLKAIPHR
jgi:N-acylglucosamine-6-phosphate 2-epimerase